MRAFHVLLLFASAGFAQQSAGTSPEWDVRANMAALATEVQRLEPLLKQVKPAEWVQRGGPEAYIRQLKSSQASVQILVAATSALAKDPDRLPTAFNAYFQMERMEMLVGSLKEGVRRYQSAEIANELTTMLGASSVHRDRLRQHITDLAAAREQDFRIADDEAQRCRSSLSRQGSDANRSKKR
jgi:hypothetical protein